MANTIAAALVPDILAEAMITVAPNKLAPLMAYSTDFSADPIAPRSTIQVRKATAGATTQTNATNFESGDSTLAAIAITMSQYTQSFHMLNSEMQQGHRLQHIAEINADTFANKLADVVAAVMTVGNYGAATVIGAAASFDSADLPAIYALAKNYRKKNLVLDGGHIAGLIPVNNFGFKIGQEGAFAFDGIYENNRWSGSATANLVGFICGPDAIAVGSGVPVDNEGLDRDFLDIRNVEVPQLGLTVRQYFWISRSSRQHWASYDIIFGAAAGDTTQAELLITA